MSFLSYNKIYILCILYVYIIYIYYVCILYVYVYYMYV